MILPSIPLPVNCLCPECGRPAAVGTKIEGRVLAACGHCYPKVVAWEPLPADAPADLGMKPQPFRRPCDNCAFHRNSPERRDEQGWADLTMSMALREQPFFCHKGVPVQTEGDGYPVSHGFRYPLTPEGNSDVGRLRVCAGFIAWWRQLAPTEPVPGVDQ